MAIITINGQIGAGITTVGPEVARLLGVDYVDTFILQEAARRLGATVAAVSELDQRPSRLSERLARAFRNFLEQSATTGAAGDPFLGPSGIETVLSRPYPEVSRPSITKAQELDDQRLVKVMNSVIHDLAQAGNVVIAGRASNIILADDSRAFHVCLVASWESRVKTIMARNSTDQAAAEKYVREYEAGRVAYFKKFYKVDANDPSHFHLVINTDRLPHQTAARVVASAVKEVGGSSP
jgi:cytidylate kinase